jgi:hypothetical protein
MSAGNGGEVLPDDRKAAVAYGLEQFQRMQHEADRARTDRDLLRVEREADKARIEAQERAIIELENRCNVLLIQRDEAVAHRIKWETFFASLHAQMRAFEVPSVPLIVDKSEQHREPDWPPSRHEDALEALARLSIERQNQQ